KQRPDLVVMDIGLPGLNGIEATIEILRHSPQTRVVILSIHDDENSVVSAIRSGARAFVLKRASSADLIDALRNVAGVTQMALAAGLMHWNKPDANSVG